MAIGLAGCGDHLGSYEVEEVRLVDRLPQHETLDLPPRPYPEFLRIELSSETDLNAVETGPGLYADADFCPFRDPYRLIALGPVAGDELAVENWRRGRALERDRRDGRYHYVVYLVPSSPPRNFRGDSEAPIPGYDLRRELRDLCLRFFVPGYNIIPSRSDVVRVEAGAIAEALAGS